MISKKQKQEIRFWFEGHGPDPLSREGELFAGIWFLTRIVGPYLGGVISLSVVLSSAILPKESLDLPAWALLIATGALTVHVAYAVLIIKVTATR